MEQKENYWHGAESCTTLYSCEYVFVVVVVVVVVMLASILLFPLE